MIFGRMIQLMKRLLKRIGKILLIFVLILLLFVLVINIPIISLSNKVSNTEYNNWMSESLSSDSLVKDIAMLGAHDAFSSEINIFSDLDPYETNSILQGATGVLVKGFMVKQSVTQICNATTLLNQGVRYLDIRLSYYDDTWFTKHNYISEDFESIADNITDFLEENPGEFLILDFQHVDGVDYESLLDYSLFTEMLDEYGLIDYAYTVNDLSALTYGELTNNGTEAKVIIISKFIDSNTKVLEYDSSIRSNWADSDDFDYVYDFLVEDAESSTEDIDKFRVMQAVTTMELSGSGIVNALSSWSLINRAKQFNNYLINKEGFDDLIDKLPIIMVDYANCNSENFNDNIMEIIIDFNENR